MDQFIPETPKVIRILLIRIGKILSNELLKQTAQFSITIFFAVAVSAKRFCCRHDADECKEGRIIRDNGRDSTEVNSTEVGEYGFVIGSHCVDTTTCFYVRAVFF